MNATNNNNNNNNNKKPFCKVCADAGKTYTAHYVRLNPDPKSPVVCPTLLALECRYCFKFGHTVKYCAVAKKNNKLRMNLKMNLKINRDRHTVVATTNTTVVQDKSTTYNNNNKFAALLEQEDEDNNNMEPHATTSTTTQINNNNTWASIAKTTPTTKNTTKNTTKLQPVDNYQYHCWAEDYSRSPNLEAWLSEPSEEQELQLQEEELQEELTLADKYGDRLYHILYEYYRERAGKIVGMLLECSEEELAYFMSNRLYLEERANEAFELLQQDDVPVSTIYRTEVEDW